MSNHAGAIIGAPDSKVAPPHHGRRIWIPRVLTTFVNLAFDSAAKSSLKGLVGEKKVYKIVEELNGIPSPLDLNYKKHASFTCAVNETQVQIEKMQEDMNNVLQQNETATEHITRSETLKKTPNENIKGSELLKADQQRIFIRSRL